MPLGKMIAMANIARNLDLENMQRLIIDVNMIEPYTTEKGAQVLLPKMDKIKAAVDGFFAADTEKEGNNGETAAPTTAPPVQPTPTSSASAPVQPDVRIAVLNGTPAAGREKELADVLIAHGYNVVGTGQADRTDYSQTQIIASEDGPVVRQLADLLAVSDQNIRPGSPEQLQSDIVVIIGADFVMP
jgi:hypothetical protein